MRKKLTLSIIGIGLFAAVEIRAQQPAPNISPAAEPNVTRCVMVFGAVRAPARLELRRRVHIYEVIAMAGGLTDGASGTVRVIHTGTPIHAGTQCTQPEIMVAKERDPARKSDTYVLSELLRREGRTNPYVEDGDAVIVTKLETVLVAGSVSNPREIYLKEPVTLMQAIKLAGGEVRNSQAPKAVIYRKDAVGNITIEFNLAAIRKHRAEDPILQPNDIVIVGLYGHSIPFNRYPTFDSRPLIPLPYRIFY
jgi:protein involved in polysaccharide export with SLBB domain